MIYIPSIISNIAGEQFEFPYVKDTGYDEFGQRVYLRYGNDVESRYRYDEKRRWLTRTTGHFQEGTNTGEFRWDPIDGATNEGRKLGQIRNIFITPKSTSE